MKTIHLFFNGREAQFPENNDWEKFDGHDAVRLFLTCAESWRRQGWNVKRLTTAKVVGTADYPDGTSAPTFEYDFPAQEFTGRIATEGKWYPADNWQLCAKCATLEPDENGEIWIGSFDVFNWGFTGQGIDGWSQTVFDNWGCVSFQREHFSMACFVATPEWFVTACELLKFYDMGKMPRIPGKYTSDETILRKYAEYTLYPQQSFPLTTDQHLYPLTHYARSTIRGAYEGIDVI